MNRRVATRNRATQRKCRRRKVCCRLLELRKSGKLTCAMTNLIQITPRGTVTLPKAVRKQAGFQPGDQLAAEITPDGILLRPVAAFPIELYTDERIEEFRKAEQEIANYRFP